MCGVYDATITDEIDLLNESAITKYIADHMSVNMLKYLIVTDVYTAACVASCVNEWKNNSSATISLTFNSIEENSDGTYNLNYIISGYQPSDMSMNGFGYQMSTDRPYYGAFTCNLYFGTYTANNISFTNSTYNIELTAYGTSADINTVGTLNGEFITCDNGSSTNIEITNFCNAAFGSGFWSFPNAGYWIPSVSDQFAEIKTYHTWENFLLGAFPSLNTDFAGTAADWANLTCADIANDCEVYDVSITDEVNLSDESEVTQFIANHMSVNMLKYLIVTDVYTAACVANCCENWDSDAIISLTFNTIEEGDSDNTYNLDYTIDDTQNLDQTYGCTFIVSHSPILIILLYYGQYTATNITLTNKTYHVTGGGGQLTNIIGTVNNESINCDNNGTNREITNFCNSAIGNGFWYGDADQEYSNIQTYHTWKNFLLGAFPNIVDTTPEPTPEPSSNSNIGLAIGLGVGLGVPAVGGIGFGTYYGVKKKKNKK